MPSKALGATPPAGSRSLEYRESHAQEQRTDRPRFAFGRARESLAFVGLGAARARFDLRNEAGQNYVTAVRDQKSCGSCVAFGVCATAECTYQYVNHDPTGSIDFSEADLFYCSGSSAGVDCESGWWPTGALSAFAANGVVKESCFPYTPGNQACRLCDFPTKGYIAAYTTLYSRADMKQWLIANGALCACFTVYEDFESFNFRDEAVYRKNNNSALGGHCVSVVGYDDSRECWICKNSWGPAWGDQGFFYIGYGQCGIDSDMWGVTGVSAP